MINQSNFTFFTGNKYPVVLHKNVITIPALTTSNVLDITGWKDISVYVNSPSGWVLVDNTSFGIAWVSANRLYIRNNYWESMQFRYRVYGD